MKHSLRKTDYTFMWWAHGFRGTSEDGKRILCLKSGNYGMAIDTSLGSITNFGAIANPMTPEVASAADNGVIYNLPKCELCWEIESEGEVYQNSGSSAKNYEQQHLEDLKLPLSLMSDSIPGEQTRIIESGRYVQRFDMQRLYFTNKKGDTLHCDARVEVSGFTDYVAISLVLNSFEQVSLDKMTARLSAGSKTETVEMSCEKGKASYRLSFFISPSKVEPPFQLYSDHQPLDVSNIKAVEFSPKDVLLSPEFVDWRGVYRIELPNLKDCWEMESNKDMMERVHVQITNDLAVPVRMPLMFSKECDFAGVTGLTPILRDLEGNPLGIPVQISKNWHYTKGKSFLYQGPWFRGYTLIDVPAGESVEFELTIAYAHWGGVPAVSHSQLCLIGYGVNQLWDQVAIGSFGESITYDPDVNLGRAMIDDIRPLLVTSMSEEKWTWTNNVGGGDFLVYYDAAGEKQLLSRMKTYYKQYGPNLTEVHYVGESADHKISAHISVSSPRCDDINRAYHRFRYDVNEPVQFSRIAFYQLGADGYNNHQFNKIAYGYDEGVVKEWTPDKGGLVYEIESVPLIGNQPWVSLHASVPGLHYEGRELPLKGAWANRGMIIRSFEARIGGKMIKEPSLSVFLTEDQVGSANAELVTPSGINELQSGDYIECEVELVILPMFAKDYYGPDEAFKRSLELTENTWKPVQRQAEGNDLTVIVTSGKLINRYPLHIEVNKEDHALFSVEGGISYIPMTFSGVGDYKDWTFSQEIEGEWYEIVQVVSGGDYWQTEYDPVSESFSIIFNVQRGSEKTPQNFKFNRRHS